MIASRSFLFMCDHHIENPESESRRIPTTFPQKEGETIYIHPTALNNFLINYLPSLKFPFILLSGDSDTTVPNDVREEAQKILDHPLLIKWYSQNCIEPQDKLFQLPIGLDFHTLSRGAYSWGPQQSLESQMQDIMNLKNIKYIRVSKCYANFQFLMNTRYAGDRNEAIQQIPKNLVFYEPRKTTRMNCWKNMIQCKYVISPHGNGLDCHRTWEALILGCIPIVKTSPLDPMFAGLPVLIVQKWSDITQTFLDNFKPEYSQIHKLELSYWKILFNKNVVSE
jgi:hypothetical protein